MEYLSLIIQFLQCMPTLQKYLAFRIWIFHQNIKALHKLLIFVLC